MPPSAISASTTTSSSGSSSGEQPGRVGGVAEPTAGRPSSGQPNAARPNAATPSQRGQRRSDAHGSPAPSRGRGPGSGRVTAARHPAPARPATSATVSHGSGRQDLGDLRRERRRARPPRRAVGPSATTSPSASTTVRSATSAASSTSWVASTIACPSAASSRRISTSRALAGVVEAAGRLVEQEQRRARRPARRRARARAAGPRTGRAGAVGVGDAGQQPVEQRRGRCRRAAPASRSAARALVGDRVRVEQVARVLRDQADLADQRPRAAAGAGSAPPTRDRPASGACSPASAPSSVDLPAPLRPISATISPGAQRRGRRRAAPATGPQLHGQPRVGDGDRRRRPPAACRAAGVGRPAARAAVPAAPAGVAHRQRQRRPAGHPAQLHDRRGDRASAPCTSAGSPSTGGRPPPGSSTTRSAYWTTRSSRCSAITTVVPEVVHQPVQRGEHVLGRGRVERGGRLVEHQHPRVGGQHRADRDPLLLAAGERAQRPRRAARPGRAGRASPRPGGASPRAAGPATPSL